MIASGMIGRIVIAILPIMPLAIMHILFVVDCFVVSIRKLGCYFLLNSLISFLFLADLSAQC